MNYFAQVKPTYIENWPARLAKLSIEQWAIPLTLDEAAALGTNIMELGEGFMPRPPGYSEALSRAQTWIQNAMLGRPNEGPQPTVPELKWERQDISGIRRKVAEGLSYFPDGAFIRLGSRSPKDSWYGITKGFKVTTQEEALRILLDCSERVADDLHLALAEQYPPHIFLRQWVNIEPWAEFRCFMRGRKLIGISQYQYNEFFPQINEDSAGIYWAIGNFFQDEFRDAAHLNDVVFDVFLRKNHMHYDVRLLEINPYGEWTDPCLYDWMKPNLFDGGMRWVREPKPQKPPTSLDLE